MGRNGSRQPARPRHRALEGVLRRQFGHRHFRPGQERIIRSLLAGRDVVAVLPTGAGKSLVFQLASQLLPGITVVVSPLLALMKDQAESVEEHGLEVGVVSSVQSAGQQEDEMEKVGQGAARLLYVTPERFENPEFLEEIRDLEVSLFAVDEAHCISAWGYDFRPSYLALPDVIEELGRPTVLALTATAGPLLRRDITARLRLRDPDVVVREIDRPNLFLEVRSVEKEEEDFRVVRELLLERPGGYPEELAGSLQRAMEGSGIVYTRTTRAAEETAEWLREWGIEADFYHGRRRKPDRERVQDAFMSGRLRVIAATNAFGLGVDKPDIRFVIHRDIPASVEEYYQEAGRSGRDGELARCTLIYRPADLGRAAFLSGTSRLKTDEIAAVYQALPADREVSIRELGAAAGVGKGKLRRALEFLERHRVVELGSDHARLLRPGFDVRRISLEEEDARKAFERSRLQMMRGYAELWDCRRRYILNYFGEEPEFERCHRCDNDCRNDSLAREAAEAAERPYRAGQIVVHAAWGRGRVSEAGADTLVVDFEREGRKTLSARLVREDRLLEVVDESGPEEPAPFSVGDRVTHPEHGRGDVHRVTPESVTVLFEKGGYRTLDREYVLENGLLALVEEEE